MVLSWLHEVDSTDALVTFIYIKFETRLNFSLCLVVLSRVKRGISVTCPDFALSLSLAN